MSQSDDWPVALEITPAVMDSIETHAYSNLKAEVGGMLVGEIREDVTHIVGSVPALSAAAEQVSLTFTHEVWNEILGEVDEKFPGKTIVGWYHTHPTFGLFLSQYDEFIQRNFFSSPGQVALVIDPVAGQLSWFSLEKNAIVKFGETPTRRGSRSRGAFTGSADGPRAGIPQRKAIAITALAVAMTAALTWSIGLAVRPPDATGALQQRNTEYLELVGRFMEGQNDVLGMQARLQDMEALSQEREVRLQEILSSPVVLYTVQEGDTLESIALRFYKSPEAADFILEASSRSPRVEIRPGDVLRLPDVPGVTVQDRVREQFLFPPWEPPASDEAPDSDTALDGELEPSPTGNPSPAPSENPGP